MSQSIAEGDTGIQSSVSNVIFPIDLAGLFKTKLARTQREPFSSGLYLSQDLLGSLRHAQLRIAGAPRNPESLGALVRMESGTMWHERVGDWLLREGIPFMQEVNIKPWLPDGWGGRVDWVFYHPEYKAFVLGDLKTTKGENMWWVNKAGAKEDHLWQLSAYWHALVRMGLPMVKAFGVCYLPMTDSEVAELSIQECDPIPEDEVLMRMVERADAVNRYRLSLGEIAGASPGQPTDFITSELAAETPRGQKLIWDSKKRVWNVVLTPHWSTRFCPFDDALCSCSLQGTTKIGHYELGEHIAPYVARKGYETEDAIVSPTEGEIVRRRKERADGV